MPTNQKTTLGLNNWTGDDKPKRSDFTADNALLDSLLTAHFSNTNLHLTEDFRTKLEKGIEIGEYFGDGKKEKSITLSFAPKLVVVFMPLHPPVSMHQTKNHLLVNMGIATKQYGSMGMASAQNTFTVGQSDAPTVQEGAAENLNSAGETYCYAAFR